MSYWTGKRVAVLGGASHIGSHVCEELIRRDVGQLMVIDDLSSGRRENLPSGGSCTDWMLGRVFPKLWVHDLRCGESWNELVSGVDVVFHLACATGGRGYTDTHDVQCAGNFLLDGMVFKVCHDMGVGKVVFASSACIYPVNIQNTTAELRLSEDMGDWNKSSLADRTYGWAKLMGEMTLDAYAQAYGMSGVSPRFFTVYGPRAKESHAIIALIAKTLIRQEPYEIWGSGDQIRNWTYVTDTARGMVLAAEKMERGAVNIGTEHAITPNYAASQIWDIMGWQPTEIVHKLDAPTGPFNRVADATKAHELLGWRPEVPFRAGLEKTIAWYTSTHNVDDVRESLERSLTER